jgi:hypothetical protein
MPIPPDTASISVRLLRDLTYRPFALALPPLHPPAARPGSLETHRARVTLACLPASLLSQASDVPTNPRRLHASNPLTAHPVRASFLALDSSAAGTLGVFVPDPIHPVLSL